MYIIVGRRRQRVVDVRTPRPQVRSVLDGASSRWREPGSDARERASLAPVAHAFVVSFSENEAVADAMHADLALAERFSTLCAARADLRAVVALATEAAPSPLADRVREWVAARAAGGHSEAKNKSYVEALIADRLDPTRLPLEEARRGHSAVGTNASATTLLTTQAPAAATRTVAETTKGVLAMADAR